jgi:hypothetical protein
MVVTSFRTGGGGGVGALEEPEDELDDEPEDELEDEPEDEPEDEGGGMMGVVGITLGAKVETVSLPLLATKTLVELATRTAYTGWAPTIDSEDSLSPDTSMVVLAPGWFAPFCVITTATLLKPGLGRVGMIGVATGR